MKQPLRGYFDRFKNAIHPRISRGCAVLCSCVALTAGLAAKGDMVYDTLGVYEAFQLEPRLGASIALTDYQWYARPGDNPDWKGTEWDADKWTPIEIGRSILEQEFPGGFVWYRVNFELPQVLENADALLLDLGRISFFDQVFLNGVEVGSYGTHPPDRPLSGSSFVERQYLVDGSLLKSEGENALTVRVYLGSWGGLWQGPYELIRIEQPLLATFDYKSDEPEEAMFHFLTDRDYLNEFYFGNPVLLRPALIDLRAQAKDRQLQLDVQVRDASGATIDTQSIDYTTRHMQWVRRGPLQLKVDSPGRYTAHLVFSDGDRTIWEQTLNFAVGDFPEAASVIVEPDLRAPTPAGATTRRVHEEAVGRYGARYPEDNSWILRDAMADMDNRGSLAYISRLSLDEPDVLVFQNNVQPTPLHPYPVRYYQDFPMGQRWDRYSDLWSFGYISIGGAASRDMKLELEQSGWSGRGYRFDYGGDGANGSYLRFHNSGLIPAYLVATDAPGLRIFDRIGKWGLGLPSHIAYDTGSGITVQNAAEALDGARMGANWILVWFNGSTGWDYFDIPWLFVFENRPNVIVTGSQALNLEFPHQAGRVLGMPLFGVRQTALAETSTWDTGLPPMVRGLCERWSRILLDYPIGVVRDFEVDYAGDRVLLKDSFKYERIEDAWGTKPLTVAPVSPTLMLSALSGNIDIRFAKPVEDYHLTTLHGPFTAIEGTAQNRFEIRGLLPYVTQARMPLQAPDINDREAYEQARAALAVVLDELREENALDSHPWQRSLGRPERQRTLNPGISSRLFNKIINALPYLDESVKADYTELLHKEIMESYLMEGLPDPAWREKVHERFRNEPQFTLVKDERSGMELSIFAYYRAANRRAIDAPFWAALQIYNIWQYAHYLDGWEAVKDQWDFIVRLFNTTLLSHDWATSQSWDSYSGYRIGNGIQEGPGLYAGFAAVARMADALGDAELRDYATYFAVMQIIGTNASATAIDYVRRNRPYSAFNSESASMTAGEQMMRHRYVEFNEFAGCSQYVIMAPFWLISYESYFDGRVPEAKRIYRDIWPETTQYFFTKSLFPAPMEAKVHMKPSTAEDVRRTYKQQVIGRHGTGRAEAMKVEAALAYLEFLGGTEWVDVIHANKDSN